MSVYHCPLCPLIFSGRSEVDRHLAKEHRPSRGQETGVLAEMAAAALPLDRERLRVLRSSRGHPSVSLLLSTAPSASMTVLDIARLRQLAEGARRRLAAEPDAHAAEPHAHAAEPHAHAAESNAHAAGSDAHTGGPVVQQRLAHAVSVAETLPTDRGLAVLVNQEHIAVIALPFAPRDRHVVDAAFATRDLDYTLRRHPFYRVVVLGHHPRVLEGRRASLSAVDDEADSRCVDVDLLLDRRANCAGPLPLVAIGDRRHLDQFCQRSRHAGHIIAKLVRPRVRRIALAELAPQAVERWLAGQQRRALDELVEADADGQVAWGVQTAWRALHSRQAERIWLEHDFAVPGRTVPDAHGVETASDPAEPGVVDDLLDVLMTRADQLGVPVEVLDPGTLERPEPVAARMCTSAHVLAASAGTQSPLRIPHRSRRPLMPDPSCSAK